MTRPSPNAARLFALQLDPRPEQAEELAFLEEYQKWKAANGVKAYEYKRGQERYRQLKANYELRVKLNKKP